MCKTTLADVLNPKVPDTRGIAECGILKHLDIVDVSNLLATSKEVQASVANVMEPFANDVLGVSTGHGMEKHCLDAIDLAGFDPVATVEDFRTTPKAKGKMHRKAFDKLSRDIPKLGETAIEAQTLLKMRVIGIDPETQKLPGLPKKGPSSAFRTRGAFTVAMHWFTNVMRVCVDHKNASPNKKYRSGTLKLKGGAEVVVEYSPNLGGLKFIAPAAAIFGGQVAENLIGFDTNHKFPEIAGTIREIATRNAKNAKKRSFCRKVIVQTADYFCVQKEVTQITAIFELPPEPDKPAYLKSMYPSF